MPNKCGVEDTKHCFLLCRTNDANRLDLLNSVNAISLPHGLINLSNETRKINKSYVKDFLCENK